MFYVFVSTAVLCILVGAAALSVFAGYKWRDLMVLAFLGWMSLYLSRYDLWLWREILGRPYPGIYFYLTALCLLLLLFRTVFGQRPSLNLGLPLLLVFVFAFLSLVSGAVNGAGKGIPAAIHVCVIFTLPLLTTALWVDVIPRTLEASRRLRMSFILLCGLMTPLMVLVSSVAPDLFGALLGWSVTSSSQARGFSPLGSAIATGMISVLAFGLAMHEVIGNRKRWYIVVLVLTGVAAAFSLARSVVLMLIIFNAIYFAMTMRRHAARIVGLLAVSAIIMFPVMFKLQQRYSFERLSQVGGASMNIRASSAVAAGHATLRSPLFGHGPGLLYEEVRTDWLQPTGTKHLKHQTTIFNYPSAMEPHNVYLLIGAEHGIPALLVFGLFMLALWRRTRVPGLQDPRVQSMSAAYCGLWAASAAMLLTTSSPMLNPQASVFFWLFAFSGLHWRTSLRHEMTRQVDYVPELALGRRPATWQYPIST